VPLLSKRLYDLIGQRPRSTPELKRLAPGAESGYDRAITALMMSTDVLIVGFESKIDSMGRPYGWSISRYALADQALGGMTRAAFDEDPRDSFERMRSHILKLCPGADPRAVERLLKA